MMEVLLPILQIAHLLLGFYLIYLAAQAYKRTGLSSMLFLALGFGLIIIGDTAIEDLLYRAYNSFTLTKSVSEVFEIAGFLVLLYAVKRSGDE